MAGRADRKGALGQKTGAGIFRKGWQGHRSSSTCSLGLPPGRPRRPRAGSGRDLPKNEEPAEKFAKLRASGHPQASSCGRCSGTCSTIALTIWPTSPTPRATWTWRSAGALAGRWPVRNLAGRRLEAGRRLDRRGHRRRQGDERAPLPDWVFDGRDGVHGRRQLQPGAQRLLPRSACRCTSASAFPDPLLGERFDPGETIFENDGVRLWADAGDDIAVVSFKTKMHTVNDRCSTAAGKPSASPSATSPGWCCGSRRNRSRPAPTSRRRARACSGRQRRRLRGDGRQLPDDQPADQVFARAGGRGGAQAGAGRRLRFQMHAPRTVAAPRSYIGTGRGRRRPVAGGRRPEGVGGARLATRPAPAATCSPN